jgi:putative ABC transport system permease protein
VALAVSLLIVAGLIVRTMMAFVHLDLGFNPAGMLTMQMELPERKYPNDAAVAVARERLLEGLARAPGVRGVATVSSLPVLAQDPVVKFDVEGRPASSRPEDRPWFRIGTASREYFQTAGIPVLRGRAFTTDDRTGQPLVAVLSREAAHRYWPDEARAVGSRISWTDDKGRSAAATVVGVVGNTVTPDLEAAPDPQMYLCAEQRPERAFGVVIRGSDPAALNSHVRAAVRSVDSDLAIYKLTTMDEALNDEFSSSLVLTSLFGAFAVLAFVLATTGLYAVISYSVSQRRQEIAVRVALGASPQDIRRLVFGEGFKLTLAGLAVGLLGAFGLARTMSSILYGVTPTDPVTYGIALAALLTAAFMASLAPAMRASNLDPVKGLRQE